MRRPSPLFILALLVVALCAATLTTAAPAPAPHPASNRDLSQAPGAISGRSPAPVAPSQPEPLERSPRSAPLVKRSLAEKAVLGARSFSSPSRRMRTGGAKPRLMPFPALDEPIRRAGGLMEAFRTRGRN